MFTINHNNHEHSKYTIRNMSWKTVERHLCSCLPCIGNTVTVTGGANCTGGPQVDRTTQLTFSSPPASNQLNSTDIYFYDFPFTIYASAVSLKFEKLPNILMTWCDNCEKIKPTSCSCLDSHVDFRDIWIWQVALSTYYTWKLELFVHLVSYQEYLKTASSASSNGKSSCMNARA